MQDDDLDRLLAQARATAPRPSAALMDRVLADALATQLQPPLRPAPPVSRLAALRDRFVRQFGGLPTAAGLGMGMAVGLLIGYSNPASVHSLTQGMSGEAEDIVDLFPTTDFLTTEG